MRIALLGGTGDMGRGLALRWCKKHEILIGSRRREKGEKLASEYLNIAVSLYGDEMRGGIVGGSNEDVASDVDVVVLTVPYEFAEATVEKIRSKLREDQVVVSPLVPMKRSGNAFLYDPYIENGRIVSYAELVARKLRNVPIVSAFQTISAKKLADVTKPLNYDVPIAGDDPKAVDVVKRLVADVPNLRPLYVGPLSVSSLIESLTPLILNVAVFSGIKDASIAIVE